VVSHWTVYEQCSMRVTSSCKTGFLSARPVSQRPLLVLKILCSHRPAFHSLSIRFSKSHFCLVRWLTSTILATQEAETRRTKVWSHPPANNSWDPILKKNITKKGWRSGLSSKSTCLACVRPWVQTPVLQKKVGGHSSSVHKKIIPKTLTSNLSWKEKKRSSCL
jgi:hypothetical protein